MVKFKWDATAVPASGRKPAKPAKSFSCTLQCSRCTALKPDGAQCTRRVCVGKPFCWSHARSQMNLAIKKSSMPNAGKGLFAIRTRKAGLTPQQRAAPVFKTGQTIARYTGQNKTVEQLQQDFGEYTAPYAFKIGDNIVDAACDRGIAALANRKPESRANAKLTKVGTIKAVKNIYDSSEPEPGRPGKGEIFVDYGMKRGKNDTEGYEFEPNVTMSLK